VRRVGLELLAQPPHVHGHVPVSSAASSPNPVHEWSREKTRFGSRRGTTAGRTPSSELERLAVAARLAAARRARRTPRDPVAHGRGGGPV
jgi:hypothetical protein